MEGRSHPASRPASPTAWIHICERCGARMEERQCKILCTNCGYARDCSDP